MTYGKFKKELLKQLRERLNGEEVTIVRGKNNGIKGERFQFKDSDEKLLWQTIHIRDIYDQYRDGVTMDDCVEFLAGLYQTSPDAEEILSCWDKAKWQIEMRIVNRRWQQKFLKQVVCQKFLDLAIYCVLVFERNPGGFIGNSVKTWMLERWGITEEELWEAAKKNLYNQTFAICSIDNVSGISGTKLEQILNLSDLDNEIYVLTNPYYYNGAVGMLRTDLLEKFAAQQGYDLYILPSSVDEVILLPDRGDRKASYLKSLVRKNNRDYADGCELSDNIYYYHRGQGKLEVLK